MKSGNIEHQECKGDKKETLRWNNIKDSNGALFLAAK
jgi:hypothetical protein